MKNMIGASLALLLSSAAAACGTGTNDDLVPPAGAVSAVPASDQKAEQQVIQVVKDWMDAIPKRDADRIGQLLADDFVAILWDGTKRSKAAYLDEIRSGYHDAIVTRQLEPVDRTVLPAPFGELLHGVGGIEIKEIPQERHSVRPRELVDRDRIRHGKASLPSGQ